MAESLISSFPEIHPSGHLVLLYSFIKGASRPVLPLARVGLVHIHPIPSPGTATDQSRELVLVPAHIGGKDSLKLCFAITQLRLTNGGILRQSCSFGPELVGFGEKNHIHSVSLCPPGQNRKKFRKLYELYMRMLSNFHLVQDSPKFACAMG